MILRATHPLKWGHNFLPDDRQNSDERQWDLDGLRALNTLYCRFMAEAGVGSNLSHLEEVLRRHKIVPYIESEKELSLSSRSWTNSEKHSFQFCPNCFIAQAGATGA